jgi:S-DNA-T family DNA segregation ATPase FtsK/SpoIIIE
VALVDALGVKGVVVLLAVAVLTVKSKTFRKAEWKAFRSACRLVWRLVRFVWTYWPGRVWPTREERRILRRLAPHHWREHAERRGLGGTLTGRPRLTEAGITCAVRLDGTWTVAKLRAAEPHIRNLLGCRTGLRIEVTAGKRGGWASVTLRTRLAVDGADLSWTPERKGIGLDAVTGKAVVLTPYGFRLVAGVTGMGKSVALRPWIAEVLANPTGAVVYIDPKRQEQTLWGGKLRVAAEPDDIYAVVGELEAELRRRQAAATGTTWKPTPEAPELVVIVDEGAAIVRMAKQARYRDILDKFEALATMGRAARIWLVWATQYPTKEQGCPAQVIEMMLDRVALTVDSKQADRTIFGENAAAKGWEPSELSGRPGEALVKSKGRKPNPVRFWFMDDDTARSLPAGIVWHGPAAAPVSLDKPAPTAAPVAASDGPADAAPAGDTRSAVLAALRAADGPVSRAELVAATGRGKTAVAEALTALTAEGLTVRTGGGSATRYTLAPATEEKSA